MHKGLSCAVGGAHVYKIRGSELHAVLSCVQVSRPASRALKVLLLPARLEGPPQQQGWLRRKAGRSAWSPRC